MSTVLNPLVVRRLSADLQRLLPGSFTDAAAAADVARQLAELAPDNQHFIIRWIEVLGRTNREVAYRLALQAPSAMSCMDRDGAEAWILDAMEGFDHRGLGCALERFDAVHDFATEHLARRTGVPVEQRLQTLRHLVNGLSGRSVKIATADDVYTDTETLFVPQLVTRFASREDNFRLLKTWVMHLWAQTWYGTWRADLLKDLLTALPRKDLRQRFCILEHVRLGAVLAREFPGVGRDMRVLDALSPPAELPAQWQERTAPLRAPAADARLSLDLALQSADLSPPQPGCYATDMFPERVREVLEERVKREREVFRCSIGKLRQSMDDAVDEAAADGTPRGHYMSFAGGEGGDSRGEVALELRKREGVQTLPNDMRGLVASIVQDFGEVPEDYWLTGGSGEYPLDTPATPPSADSSHYAVDDGEVNTYREWDYTRNRYRRDFCTLRVLEVEPADDGFVEATVRKYAHLLKSIQRTFEAVRGEVKVERRQPFGDDVDLDALVEAHVDRMTGKEINERIFTRLDKNERNIAVMFMVDMSGSTKGWVNLAEKEALVLLCEALQTLGDRYAVYGFSGRTHKRCEVYRIKRFEEAYSPEVKGRISAISPKTYTRMGAAIRHLTEMLNSVPARTKLLITLSDGKPEDYGGYRGRYGVEDTRHALLEARRDNVHPFCITIDTEAGDYLPHMYGAANYAIVDEVHKLPLKVADIYRRLTT